MIHLKKSTVKENKICLTYVKLKKLSLQVPLQTFLILIYWKLNFNNEKKMPTNIKGH